MDKKVSDVLRKGFLLGVGVLSLTQEKLKTYMDDLIKRGEVTEKQGKKLAEEVSGRAQETKEFLEKTVEKITVRVIEKLKLATKDDIKKIEEKVRKIEKKLS